MRELLSAIQNKTAEAKNYMADGENKDVAKATALMDEVDALQKEYDAEKRIYDAEKANGAQGAADPVKDSAQGEKGEKGENAISKFAKAVRSIIQGKGLVEGVGEDGGYTVPEDVSTRVEHYRDVSYSLLQDIDVVPVKTNKGSRTYQKKGEVDTFVDIDENGEITNEIEAPKFERIPYAIQDRAGFMPVSNDLVNDSDANIMEIVSKWLGEADVATTNAKVLAKVAEKAQTDLKNIDGIKTALNVTLGQAYKNGAKIYTNDDGLNYLDTLKDENGRPMLNPDPTAPAKLQLRCGTTVLAIKVLPNKVFKSTGTKVPFIVGNLFDYVRKYDRQSMSIMASTTASIGNFNAFAQNMTLLRAIVRDDYRVKDADSIVNGYIDTAAQGN
jgi:HK97 family phage major capsid protein